MSNYRISVLLAIYNCAETLPEAIDSLYNQTYQNFKLILCDDASTDHTYAVAEEYAKKHDNIVLIQNKENLKLAASLNHCLEYADTEYVARMDGDDISLPERFKKQIDFLDTHQEYAVVSCGMIHFDENGDWGKGCPPKRPDREYFKIGTPHIHGCSMIRTAVMKQVKGYSLHKYNQRGQDYHLWYKIYKAGYAGYNLQEYLYKMRDDKEAFKRRTLKHRYFAFRKKMYILKEFNIKNRLKYSLPSLLKGFVPHFIMKSIKKKKMSL